MLVETPGGPVAVLQYAKFKQNKVMKKTIYSDCKQCFEHVKICQCRLQLAPLRTTNHTLLKHVAKQILKAGFDLGSLHNLIF